MWAWTPGLSWSRHAGLAGLGLDGVFASTPWWDGRAAWYVEEHESLRLIAPVIGLAEAPLRVPPVDIDLRRRMLRLAATTAGGLMMPAGFEDEIEADVRQATREVGCLAKLSITGEMRRLTGSSATVTVLARLDAADGLAAQRGVAALINNDLAQPKPLPVSLDPLDPAAAALLGAPRMLEGGPRADHLAPGEISVGSLEPLGPSRARAKTAATVERGRSALARRHR